MKRTALRMKELKLQPAALMLASAPAPRFLRDRQQNRMASPIIICENSTQSEERTCVTELRHLEINLCTRRRIESLPRQPRNWRQWMVVLILIDRSQLVDNNNNNKIDTILTLLFHLLYFKRDHYFHYCLLSETIQNINSFWTTFLWSWTNQEAFFLFFCN